MTGSDVRGDVLQRLDTAAARRWAVVTRAAFAARRAEIDALNVFPVPDGDTGTNLYLTFDAGLDAARVEYEDRARRGQPPDDEDLATEADVFARALLLTARGNSGVILSQIFRGFADEAAATGVSGIGAQGLAAAMTRADELAWSSVAHPVEGTILSVSQAASRAATEAAQEHGDDLYAVSTAALEAARAALAATPSQLPRLAQAGRRRRRRRRLRPAPGVARAGGDRRHRRRVVRRATTRCAAGPGWTQPVTPVRQGGDLEPGGPAYEVMYLLSEHDRRGRRGPQAAAGRARRLAPHRRHGRPAQRPRARRRRRRRHRGGHRRRAAAPDQGDALPRPDGDAGRTRTPRPSSPAPRARGWPERFKSAGAWVVPSGPRRRANAAQFLEAVRSTGAGQVILLPNDGDTLLAANAAAKVAAEEGVDLRVVHARTAVQGIAALAVYDPDRPFGDNVLEMSSAAAATRNGAVTVATKEALTSGGPCRPGDVLGVVDGDIVIVGDDLTRVGAEVVERLLSSGGELLTVVSGEDATPALGEDVAGVVRSHRRDLEVTQIYGGQPVYPLLLGVE